jgi:hypothetical protein
MFNYYKAEEDLRYLLKLDDYEYLPEIDTEYLEEVYDNMCFEVQDIAIKANRKAQLIYEKHKDIVYLNNDFILIQQIIPFLSQLETAINISKGEEFEKFKALKSENIKTLESFGFKIKPKADYFQELARIQKQSKQMQTRVKLKELDLKSLTGDGDDKIDIYSEVASVERYLNQEINMHTMVMRKWLTKKYKVYNETQEKALKDGRSSK